MTQDSAVTKTGRHGKILLVEDDKNVRSGLTLMLQSWGFEVIQAEDARNGLLKAKTMAPDLVILDIILPVRSGFELCRKLKSEEGTRTVPVLLLSALSVEEQKKEKHWKGAPAADGYMAKPYKARELLEALDRLLPAKSSRPPHLGGA
ncbi:MAG: response regulator [Planctomycetes bacterium]|nr:response regulator [Planctomycetota bacterium]